MDKTIENIKKILHLGGSKPGKKNEKSEKIVSFSPAENGTVNHHTVTASVEVSRDQAERRSPVEPRVETKVPLAADDGDGEEEDDTLPRCGGCRRGMKNGPEITLSCGQSFHFSCFRCSVCGVDVSQQKYAFTGGLLLCEPCIKTAVRTTCHKCILTIEMNDVKLIVDGKEFHRACFSCFSCSVLLDSVYGSRDGQYYCETCYVAACGKRCAGCGQVILGEGLKFGEESYHRACFRCSRAECGAALGGGKAHSVRGRPVCGDCYDKEFMERCSVCGEVVTEGLLFRDQRFHPACFTCRTCALPLADKKGEFLLTEAGLQCKRCVAASMTEEERGAESATEICRGCELPIHVKNLVFDGESNWHFKCFVCGQCGSSLVNSKYYDKLGSLYCNNCFLAEHLPTCYNCKVEIKGKGGVKMHSEGGQTLTWHEECLQCSVCSIRLQMDNVVFRDKLFCKSCYIQTSLNRCEACGGSITGAGYSFRGLFWHDSCFGCDGCGAVFPEGKFRVLREEKLCDTCFKSATHSQ